MPSRQFPLVTGQYYHIYNRGVAKLPIFTSKREYDHFMLTLVYYRIRKPLFSLSKILKLPTQKKLPILESLYLTQESLVTILCYVLMPNHFHILVRQDVDNGISTFMSKSLNSYAKYVNIKKSRSGPLFQGMFKSVRIESDEQLVHVSRYIHLNPLTSYLVESKSLSTYPWSSLTSYVERTKTICDTSIVMSFFKDVDDYFSFILDQEDYAKQLKYIQKLTFEE